MPVTFEILGAYDSPNYEDARALQSLWENEFRDLSGTILLIPNALLFGFRNREHDLIVVGKLDPPAFFGAAKGRLFRETVEREYNVDISSFIFHIEVKSHSADKIRLRSGSVDVEYSGKWRDIGSVSHSQKFAIINYLTDCLRSRPFVCNLIWFKQLPKETIQGRRSNLLPARPSFGYTLRVAALQQNFFRYQSDSGHVCFRALKDDSQLIALARDAFTATRPKVGRITRRRLEDLTSREVLEEPGVSPDNNTMTRLLGRAGTGKTKRLLAWAFRIAEREDTEVLLLTYNKALVSDLRRLIALARFDVQLVGEQISVKTFHEWMYPLARDMNLIRDTENDYIIRLEEITQEVAANLTQDRHEETVLAEHSHYRYVFIDEAQDWPDVERDIIRACFPPERLVIADGIDQMVRTGVGRTSWKAHVNFQTQKLTKSLRQKSNLIRFVKAFSKNMGYDWDVSTNKSLHGGRVVVLVGEYSKEFHEEEFGRCEKSDNEAYDYLFLCPPQLVERIPNGRGKSKSRRFKLRGAFEQMGITIWDGTQDRMRKQYPTKPNEFRVLQYDSCRGLEGWTVVCLEFDSLVEYKSRQLSKVQQDQTDLLGELLIQSDEERARELVAQWATIPLTRAIDTIVLQLPTSDSETGKLLWKLKNELDGIVDWYGPAPTGT